MACLVEKKGSNIFYSCSGGIPGPLSFTLIISCFMKAIFNGNRLPPLHEMLTAGWVTTNSFGGDVAHTRCLKETQACELLF